MFYTKSSLVSSILISYTDKTYFTRKVLKFVGKQTYNDGEVIATIRWTIADVVSAMIKNGIEPTDENIKKVLANRFQRTLEERSIEDGWEIIDTLITNTDVKSKE